MFKFIIITVILFFSFDLAAQSYTPVKPKVINSDQPQKKANKTIIENAATKTYIVKNEEYYTEFIKALEGKKTFLKADSILNKKAIDLNWYSKVDNEILKAKNELNKLKQDEK